MHYLFEGKLCGYLCKDCSEPLSNVKIKIYKSRKDQQVVELVAAKTKKTFGLLTNEQVADKSKYLLAESETDEYGKFSITFDDKKKYNGEAFEVDVCLDTVSGYKGKPVEPVQFTVTMLQPRWRETGNGAVAKWEYCIPARFWCAIRARFDVWVICGTVSSCVNNAPVAGVRVKAFDVDWIQDDPLGDAITDASGRFRIDYTGNDFRQTPFSPFINLEWTEGPDVYFHIETTTGAPLEVESRNAGRAPDRENIGPCYCVSLCLSGETELPEPTTIPLFTNVGKYKVDANPVDSDFTNDGTTKSGGYVTGVIPLIGIIPDGTAAEPVEYRFRYAKHPALSTVYDADGTIIGRTKIGRLEYFAWDAALSVWVVKAADYYVNHSGSPDVSIPQSGGPDLVVLLNKPVAADGWIRVPTENQLYPGGTGRFVPSERLANFDTRKLTNESFDLTVLSPPLPLKAGDSVPAGKRSEAPEYRLYFEARKVATMAAVNSNTLDNIAMSNTRYTYNRHPGWSGGDVTTRSVTSLEITEMIAPGATGCETLTTKLHALFTAYHPYLADARVYFEGNSPLPATFVASISAGEATAGLPGHLFDISILSPCAYILWLRTEVNLTSGWGQISSPYEWDRIAFCIKPASQ